MEGKKNKFERIKSQYVASLVVSYIKDEKRILKIFIYSKISWKKFNLEKNDYKLRYLHKIIDCDYYLCDQLDSKKFKNDLLVYGIPENYIFKFVVEYYKKYLNSIENKKECIYKFSKNINLNSPLLNTLSKSDIFGKIFNIIISEDNNNNEKKKEIFKKNLLYSNYSSLVIYITKDTNDQYYNQFNIKYNQIKKLKIDCKKGLNFCPIFGVLLSFKNIKNHLVYLDLNIQNNSYIDNSFKELNDFKLLKYLKLSNFIFNDTFQIELTTLEKLSIISCQNISFKKDIFLELKYLCLLDSKIDIGLNALFCPKLEKLEFSKLLFQNRNFDLFVDPSSLKNLKYFKGEDHKFLFFENLTVEKISLKNGIIFQPILYKVFDQIINIKTLKEIKISIQYFNQKLLDIIKGENASVNKIKIFCDAKNDKLSLDKIYLKFPNLTDLKLKSYSPFVGVFNQSYFGIQENCLSKIKRLSLINVSQDINLYCNLFKNLEYINLDRINFKINNSIINTFPIFKSDNKIIFESLISFKFNSRTLLGLDILKNVFNNIDKMPVLEDCVFIIVIQYDVKKEFFIKFIEKILSIKTLKNVNIEMSSISRKENKYYLITELMELFKEMNFSNLNMIKIKKFI